MANVVHYRVEGLAAGAISRPTACGKMGFNHPDTDQVTCPKCWCTDAYQQANTRHHEVVDALAYPKEDHPCLLPHSRR